MNELDRLLFGGLFAYLFYLVIAVYRIYSPAGVLARDTPLLSQWRTVHHDTIYEAMLSIKYTRLLASLHVTRPWCRSGALCTTTVARAIYY
jgi:hypothetical protein